jgi:hypothetical protein
MPMMNVLSRYLVTKRLPICSLASAVGICASFAAVIHPALAASPYVVDGVALGAPWEGMREYQCSPSEQFPEYEWCQRKREERTRLGPFRSTTSILNGRNAVAYVTREIRPAFFARDDMTAEIKRLSAKYGAPARELRLHERENLSRAVIVVWGSVELERLEGNDLAAMEADAVSPQSLLVDHLGDIGESLRLRLPVYRLQGGPGYVWSAAADRRGRGHLRFLAMDGPALAGTTAAAVKPARVSVRESVRDAAPSKSVKEAAALSGTKHGAALASGNDLRAFLTPQPTSLVPNDAGKPVVSQGKDKPQQSVVQKNRVDADRARLIEAEQAAAEEREKARVAWARFEAETAASEASARARWIAVASLFILMAVLALLRIMARQPGQRATGAVDSAARAKARAAIHSWMQFARALGTAGFRRSLIKIG